MSFFNSATAEDARDNTEMISKRTIKISCIPLIYKMTLLMRPISRHIETAIYGGAVFIIEIPRIRRAIQNLRKSEIEYADFLVLSASPYFPETGRSFRRAVCVSRYTEWNEVFTIEIPES